MGHVSRLKLFQFLHQSTFLILTDRQTDNILAAIGDTTLCVGSLKNAVPQSNTYSQRSSIYVSICFCNSAQREVMQFVLA